MKLRKILAGLVAGVMVAGIITLSAFAVEGGEAKDPTPVVLEGKVTVTCNGKDLVKDFDITSVGFHEVTGLTNNTDLTQPVSVSVTGIPDNYTVTIVYSGFFTIIDSGCWCDSNNHGSSSAPCGNSACEFCKTEEAAGDNNCSYKEGEEKFDNVGVEGRTATITLPGEDSVLRMTITELYISIEEKSGSDNTTTTAATSTPTTAPTLTTPAATTTEEASAVIPLVDEKSGVSVSAAAGVLEEGTELKVESADVETSDKTATFKITLEKDGSSVQPNGTVTVTIDVPAALAGASKYYVYYQADDGTLTDMNATYADGKVTFNTNHFSTYILSVEPLIAEETTAAATSEESTTAAPDVTTEAPAAITTTTAAADSTEDKNVSTGLAIAFIPAIAAATGVIISKKRK